MGNGSQEITIKKDGSLIKLKIGSSVAVVDDKNVKLDTCPVIRDSRTMVPLRFVGEQLGSLVLWSKGEQAVYINTVEEVDQEIVVDVSSTANIRQGPNTAYPVVSKVTNGTVLEAIAVSAGWYQVLLPDNSKGWISGTIVKIKDGGSDEEEGEDENEDEDEDRDEDEDNPPFEIDGDSVIFITNSVNIRTGPSVDYNVIGQGNKGDEMAALGEQVDWIKIRTPTAGGLGCKLAGCFKKNLTPGGMLCWKGGS